MGLRNLVPPAAAFAGVIALAGTAHAAFEWTGGAGGGSNWYDAANWQSGSVPNADDSDSATSSDYAIGSESAGEIVSWDSETASHMPTAVLSNSNDWFGGGWHLSPATHVKNGTINYGAVGADWWSDGSTAIDLQVGDGDMATAASVNLGWSMVNRFLKNSGNGLAMKVNADGTVNQVTDLTYRDAQSWDTTIKLNGGDWVVDGNVTKLATGDNVSTRTVSFDAAGAEFTANFGGDFADISAVNAELGDSFVDTTGGGLAATDNGDGTFTVTVVPEPASAALMGFGGLMLLPRRRRRA
jgi:hypothetical protein